MTLQQLRYVTAVAGTGTISHAVQQFYISQPSLTNAIRELEQWMARAVSGEKGIALFLREIQTDEGDTSRINQSSV